MSEPQLCSICGDAEPFHVHNEGERIDDYFTVGRGQTEFQAAQAWKARATHPSLVDLSAPETAKELAEALGVQHEQFLREPESFDTPFQIAQAILTAWRNLRREGGK